ncbi:MAG: 2-5 ligase [Pedosphaera sp.]|nr:2-5 ligase [Pedosphaera sp.]
MPDAEQKPEVVRLFIALPVPAAVKEELQRLQAELRRKLPSDCVRWTRPEQSHLTLRFLGNVAVDQVEELSAAVRAVCNNFAPLQLRAERIGFFPQIRFPRVIWAWVHDDREQLRLLQTALQEATASFTREKAEKDFTGHLTIGRTQSMKSAQARILGDLAQEMVDRVFGEWTADTVEIIRSELSSSGSRYFRVAEIPLGGGK